jgi:hypothetical protein
VETAVIPVTRKEFQDLLDRLASLEEQLTNRFELGRENLELRNSLRAAEQELAARIAEVERLKSELLLQKRAWEKELESQQRLQLEKEALLRQEGGDKLVLAQQFYDRQLALERDRYLERSGREKERVDRQLDDFHRDEGFWARVMRLLTWS